MFGNVSRSTKWRLLKRSSVGQVSLGLNENLPAADHGKSRCAEEHQNYVGIPDEVVTEPEMMDVYDATYTNSTDNIRVAQDKETSSALESEPDNDLTSDWWQPEHQNSNETDGSENDEDEDASETDQSSFKSGNEKLYNGAPLTVAESLYAIFVFALKHSLTGECLADLLVLISLHCMIPNLCHKTLYRFKKFFSNISSPLVYHYYCNFCLQLRQDKTVCTHCEMLLGRNPEFSYFIEIPILSQLQNMLLRGNFYNDLLYRFERKKTNSNIEDIYDGEEYLSLSADGFSDSRNNISFMWYTDGIPLFNSSKCAIWPIYLVINELCYKKRVQKENMIVAGIWIGAEKPAVNTFLKPLHTSLSELASGVRFNIPQSETPIVVKGRLLCGTCDTPAKSLFLNMVQFNGFYGCSNCKQRGMSVKNHTGTNTYVYPFDNENKDAPLRENGEILDFAKQAVTAGKPVFGIKGPSLLHFLNGNCITSVAIDVMHGIFLGVCRKLVYIWFDSKFRTFEFSLYDQLDTIDKMLVTIRPPSFVQRAPRSIRTYLKYWKALEYKYFLMFYSIPLLFKIMIRDYMKHHILLVSSIFLLNQESISLQDIATAKSLLIDYVSQFQILYGLEFMSINIHQLLHLPGVVSRLGPLWVTSCFPFEDFNGAILKFVHGTQYAELQIGSSVSATIFSPLINEKLELGTPVSNFCLAMKMKGKSIKVLEYVNSHIVTIGRYIHLTVLPTHIKESLLYHNADRHFGRCWMFYKLKIKRVIFASKSYKRITRHNSYSVSFMCNDSISYGQISCFIKQKLCICQGNCACKINFFALITPFKIMQNPVLRILSSFEGVPKYVLPVKLEKNTKAIPVECLINQLFFVNFQDESYIVHSANHLESE